MRTACRLVPAKAFPLGEAAGALLLILAFLAAAAAEETPRRVLILHAYNYTHPAMTSAADGARQRLLERSRQQVELDTVYLDLVRYSEPEQESVMVRFLRQRYAQRQPDVILVAGPDALPFVVEHRGEFAPGVPVVFIGGSRETYRSLGSPPDMTGHVIDLDLILDRTLALAEALQPETRQLFVIAGSAPVDRRWQEIAPRIVERRARQFETTYLFNFAYDDLLAEMSRIPPDAIVLFLNFLRDNAGRTFISGDVAAAVAGISAAPVYSPYYRRLKGPVGGFSESFDSMGSTAADIALEILAGKDPATIPPRINPDIAYRVDYEAIERWGLDEDNLPPGAIVMGRDPGVWELYRWYIIGAITLIVLQALLIAGLVVQRRRRRAAEADTRAKEGALRVSFEQVRQLNGELITAQEAERARIARELHDDVGQRLASLSIGLSALKRRAAKDAGARNELSRLQQDAVAIATDLRDLSHELHPGELQHVGLPEALRARCEELNAEASIKVELDVSDDDWEDVTDEINLCLYRVAQEALRNIVKHAQASTARITLAHRGGRITMRVADDGHGFEAQASTGQRGIGLSSMRERVRMLGGIFEMRSSANDGTVAEVSIPTGARH